MQEQITSDVEPDVSAGTTGLLDDQESSLESDQSVSVDSEPVEDDSVQFSSSDEPEVEASRLVDEKSFDPLFSSIDDEELKTDDLGINYNKGTSRQLQLIQQLLLKTKELNIIKCNVYIKEVFFV